MSDSNTLEEETLDSKWREFEARNPDLAVSIKSYVDGGETRSLDFYKGYNLALLSLVDSKPHILKNPEFEMLLYAIAYTEHQIRNT